MLPKIQSSFYHPATYTGTEMLKYTTYSVFVLVILYECQMLSLALREGIGQFKTKY